MTKKDTKKIEKPTSAQSFIDSSSKSEDKTCVALVERYGMDADIWQASKRGFPFNISLNTIVYSSMLAPLALGLYTIKYDDPQFYKLYLPTIVISFFGYKVASSLIL